MSDRRTHLPCTPNDFGAIWHRYESKHSQNKFGSTKSEKQTQQSDSADTTSCTGKDLQTPKRRANGYTVLSNVDSPGDGEVSQDIIWDPTSPTPATTGKGGRDIRVVEISDIVNRIAPKDAKSLGVDSPLLQWIGDSAVPCTQDIPQPRVRKKSTWQSNVEDLMKLAKQFDMNMQQDKETERLNKANNNLSECRNEGVAQPPAPLASTSQKLEEELHALFDCSTQRVSGRLSQSSSDSSRSQEAMSRPGGSTSIASRHSELKSVDRKSSAPACPANAEGSAGTNMDKCDDFDDDWEDNDLLNDSFVLVMAQNSEQQNIAVSVTGLQSNTRLNTNQHPSASKPTSVHSACQVQSVQPQTSSSGLQGIRPKPKTSTRSTFKLEPNPHFQGKMAASMAPGPNKTTSDQIEKAGNVAPVSVKDISDEDKKSFLSSDSLWDDGDDDDLLYQVCDNIERISSSQPEQPGPSNRQNNQDWSMKSKTAADRQSACGFVRSNSMPGTSSERVNYQGWNIPTRGTKTGQSPMSQSHPGTRVGPGTYGERRNSPGTFQAVDANPGIQPRTVTAKPPQNSSSHHASFKRNLSDSAAISNKVFVTSQMTGKCSAAEIEKKKQEALARRRLRMQTSQKP